jgi:hypothetical protein
MKIFEKRDTERHRRDINLCKPLTQPDATGFSGDETQAIEPNPSALVEDYPGEHTCSGDSVIPTGSIRTQAPTISKGTQT